MSIPSKITIIYLDNAASTPTDPRVLKEMSDVSKIYANPSSFNDAGRGARKKLEQARLIISRFLGAQPEEIILTSSGSEANNLAVFGLISDLNKGKKEIIVSPVEHPSVLEPIKNLENKGFKIHYIKVNKDGLVDLADLERKINKNTLLVSVMYANNEIGTIQPIRKIVEIVKKFRSGNRYPLVHTDACQAAGYLGMNINNLGVDLLTFNGSKIYGPKGVAVLYKKRGVLLSPLIYGGDQENSLRAGTENLVAIAGLAKAITLIDRKKESIKVGKLRDYFIQKLVQAIPEIQINGPLSERLANNVNISIPRLSDENILLELDKYGIYASSGSACTARSVEPSHVLKAIGVSPEYLGGALRFSLGRQTTKKDIDYVLKVLPGVVRELKKRYNKN